MSTTWSAGVPVSASDVPKVDGICDKCGGRIVKRAIDRSRGGYIFGGPECERCKVRYPGAKNATEVGQELFYRTHGGPSS
jgi:ssDNA-binding Zn-finger/Zn-ribbon topoisomerase 1